MGSCLQRTKTWSSLQRTESEMNDIVNSRKIVHLEGFRVAYAFAGDWIAKAVGDELSARIRASKFPFRGIEVSLRELADSTFSNEYVREGRRPVDLGHPRRSLLIAFYGLEGSSPCQLWRLDIEYRNSTAWRVFSKTVVAGALGNSTRHFQHYCPDGVPIEKLKMLAAHIVLTGHEIDSHAIDGLDVATVDSSGFTWLTEQEKKLLRERSRKLDESIRTHLFAE